MHNKQNAQQIASLLSSGPHELALLLSGPSILSNPRDKQVATVLQIAYCELRKSGKRLPKEVIRLSLESPVMTTDGKLILRIGDHNLVKVNPSYSTSDGIRLLSEKKNIGRSYAMRKILDYVYSTEMYKDINDSLAYAREKNQTPIVLAINRCLMVKHKELQDIGEIMKNVSGSHKTPIKKQMRAIHSLVLHDIDGLNRMKDVYR